MRRIVHLLTLLLSLWLLISVSADILSDTDPLRSESAYNAVCGLMLATLAADRLLHTDRRGYWRRTWPLLVASLPLLLMARLLVGSLDAQLYHSLRFLPLLRGFFSLYILVGWWVRSWGSRLLLTYLVTAAVVVYFSSLLFYEFERGVNPAVSDYADALWWAAMCFTTIGSNIIAASVVGKVLGVLMGFGGMMMLPVFTAFFTGRIAGLRDHADGDGDAD